MNQTNETNDTTNTKHIISDKMLAQILANNPNDVCIVDLCRQELFYSVHIPTAHWLDRTTLISPPPFSGRIPSLEQLKSAFRHLPLNTAKKIVAYDDEGGKIASRFLWILDCLGFQNWALLDGGLNIWLHHKHSVCQALPEKAAFDTYENITVCQMTDNVIHLEELLALVQDITPELTTETTKVEPHHMAILDVRSTEEYTGQKALAMHRGHIPGALHYEWSRLLDFDNKGRLKPSEHILSELERIGITKDQTIITYCQSHMRAALVYVVLKSFGFQVRGYDGSWGEWGNIEYCPVQKFVGLDEKGSLKP